MSLSAGSKIGHYTVLAAIGKGGMGEVWKARDAKLERDVAIKSLPEQFSKDLQRIARFKREAQVLASLNHPNIGAIYGLEEAEGEQFLVLEFIEGDTIADRLKKGAIPIEESVDLCLQIADAVEAAHEKGVVHRDLKPANIKVTPDGRVKVLDFGLAKAVTGDQGILDLSSFPTLTMGSTPGVILGTPAYMAPEQARGALIDKRADIWAFGCVFYEMLTGSRAFGGETISDVLASVLKVEPDYKTLPSTTPVRLHTVLQRCLQKDPKKRWRDAGDLRIELETGGAALDTTGFTEAVRQGSSRRRERALWLAATLIAAALTGLIVGTVGRNGTREGSGAVSSLVRFSLLPPDGVSLYSGGWTIPFTLSPDGRWLAFTATSDDGRSRLWLRAMSADAAQSIPGTEGAVNPIWSPNSEWVAYQTQKVWYRVHIPGGAPETISAFREYTGASVAAAWGDDVILYTSPSGSLDQVPVDGGKPTQATRLDPATKERVHLWPQFLSDGKRFLYVATGDVTRVYVDSISGGQRSLVMDLPGGASTIRYVPGYLFYVENMVLWAHPFDETALRLNGERRRILSGVPVAGPGAAPFSVSRTGVLAYWTQSLIQQAAQLQWMDRNGNRLGLVGSPAVYDGFDISRDESKLASAQVGKDGIELWIRDLVGAGSFPLKFNARATVPIWTPDGTRVVFLRDGALFIADANRTAGSPVRLTDPSRNQLAQSWTASGDQLVFEHWSAENGIDLAVLHMKDKHVERLPWNTNSNEFGGRLSPDDHWIAYATDQTGRNELWVAAFPSGEPRRQVSSAGGSHADWKSDGSELYFVSAEGQLTAVPFSVRGGNIELGSPANLFRIPGTIDVTAGSHNIYKANRNGQQFLVAVQSQGASVPPIRVILDWPELLGAK